MLRALAAGAALLLAACSPEAPPEVQAPPTPRFHDIDGHKIWGVCTAGGGPTVVYLHALDADSSTFATVAQRVAKAEPDVRQCSFDRVNTGASSFDTARRPLTAAVAELEAFLDDEGVDGPLVLVGQSYGGLVALAYAGAHPDRTQAMVIGDSPLPFEAELLRGSRRDSVRELFRGNRERVDLFEAYATAGSHPVPDVPLVYVDATQDVLPTVLQVPAAEYERALTAYVDALPQGRLVRSPSVHNTVINSSEFLAAILDQL
ncbi:MAG TPA: alpha/beta hydrolase [Nocardioidaceae bacterium]|nr:alpha/beta hydrolase [Nocardioidaceae bacterium]